MNNKNRFIRIILAGLAALCLTSCADNTAPAEINNQNDSQQSSDQADETQVSSVPEIDDDGNKVTVLTVTNKEGVVVTNEDKKPVTELAIVDDKGEIVTEANGSAAKPNLAKQTEKKNQENHANAAGNNNNNSNNNAGNNNNNASNNNAGNNNNSAGNNNASNNNNNAGNNNAGNNNNNDNNNNSEENEVIESLLGNSSLNNGLLWIAPTKKVNDKLIFECLKNDGDLVEVTLKISEDAQEGNYQFACATSTGNGRESSFCDSDTKSLDPAYDPAIITIGGNTAEKSIDPSKITFSLSNASANPGDTITIYASIKNLEKNHREIAAFNTYFEYDKSIITVESIKRCGLIETAGDFIAQ